MSHRRTIPDPSRQSRLGRPRLSEARIFTAAEVRIERLVLAEDMLYLVLQEGQALPPPMQRRLRQLYEGLAAMRRQAGELP